MAKNKIKSFVTSMVIGIVIILIAFLLNYFYSNNVFAKYAAIILLVAGTIFLLPVLVFLIFLIKEAVSSLFGIKNKRKGVKKKK